MALIIRQSVLQVRATRRLLPFSGKAELFSPLFSLRVLRTSACCFHRSLQLAACECALEHSSGTYRSYPLAAAVSDRQLHIVLRQPPMDARAAQWLTALFVSACQSALVRMMNGQSKSIAYINHSYRSSRQAGLPE